MFNVKKKIVIAIPTRLASTRLPNKPILLINNIPMIVHVISKALAAKINADIVVATADEKIIECINQYFIHEQDKNRIKCVLTDPQLPSGSDRIKQALDIIDPKHKYQFVLNLQGDLPTISTDAINNCLHDVINSKFDITTLVAKINVVTELQNPNVVKAVLANLHNNAILHQAIYFSRAPVPYNMTNSSINNYHHIGIYGYKRQSLKKFTALKPSNLEQIEKLEQLRALENNLTIGVRIVDEVPIGVDTQEDLLKAEQFLQMQSKH